MISNREDSVPLRFFTNGGGSVLKIAFVDDEQACLDEMERLCSSFGEERGYPVKVVSFDSGETFLEAFAAGGFDLVFMDVYMEDMDGIAAAFQMRRQDRSCLLVFLTSSAEFMPDAFSCHAFEYITKPFSRKRIFDVLSDAAKVLPRERRYMELAAGRRSVRVFLDEIVSAVTDAHYLDISLAGGKQLRCRMTMPEFMEKTDADARFFLINKGIAVNAERILGFERGSCVMESGAKFPVRVRDSVKIEQMVRNYHFEKIRGRQAHFDERSVPADGTGRRTDHEYG